MSKFMEPKGMQRMNAKCIKIARKLSYFVENSCKKDLVSFPCKLFIGPKRKIVATTAALHSSQPISLQHDQGDRQHS